MNLASGVIVYWLYRLALVQVVRVRREEGMGGKRVRGAFLCFVCRSGWTIDHTSHDGGGGNHLLMRIPVRGRWKSYFEGQE